MLLATALLQAAAPDPLSAPRLILALVCVIVASSLALGVCIGLMRRIQTIAPERPATPPAEDAPPTPETEPRAGRQE